MKIEADRFKEIDCIPSIPGQVLKALDGIARISAMDYNIVHMIQYDAPIALGVLKLANSPVYGYSSEVFSLQQAAGLLGPGAIKNVILTTPVYERYENRQRLFLELNLIDLWLHTAVTASVAGGIGALIEDVESDVCFTAGLIKDCGLIALAMNYPESIKDILMCQASKKTSLFEAEQEVIGINHAEIGAVILKNWGIPEELSNVVNDCYEAEAGNPGSRLSGVIALSSFLAWSWGYDYGNKNGGKEDLSFFLEAVNVPMQEFLCWEQRLKDYAIYAAGVINN